MIRDRIINLDTGSVQDVYYDEKGRPATKQDFQKSNDTTTSYTCPNCGSPTFGRFEPFVNRGITAWCSNCGYQHVNKTQMKTWQTQHKDSANVIEEA